MITSFQIYWLLKLDSIVVFSRILAVATVGILVIIFIFHLVMLDEYNLKKEKEDEIKKNLKKRASTFTAIFFIFSLISVFTPTTKQMAAIIVAPAIINNKKVQQIPEKVLDILGLSMDKLSKELSK